MKRLPFCLTPSSAILGETIWKHVSRFNKSHLQVVSMLEHLCVYNFLGCASDSEEELTVYKDAKEFLGMGELNLQKWNSNDKEVLREIRSIEALTKNEGKLMCAERVEIHANSTVGNNDKL